MEFVQAALLAVCRTTLEASLPDSAVIWHPTVSIDSSGGGSTAWANTGTVPARLAPSAALERALGLRWTALGDWVVTLAHDAPVVETDRLVIAGKTLDVKGIPTAWTWEICRRAVCSDTLT